MQPFDIMYDSPFNKRSHKRESGRSPSPRAGKICKWVEENIVEDVIKWILCGVVSIFAVDDIH